MAENHHRNWNQQQPGGVRPEEDAFLAGVDEILSKLNSRIFEEEKMRLSSNINFAGVSSNTNSSTTTSNFKSSPPNNNNQIVSSSTTVPLIVTPSPPKPTKKTSSLSSAAPSFVPTNFLANVAAASALMQYQQKPNHNHHLHQQSSSSTQPQTFGHIFGLQHFNHMVAPSALAAAAAASNFLPLPPMPPPPPPPPGFSSLFQTSLKHHQQSSLSADFEGKRGLFSSSYNPLSLYASMGAFAGTAAAVSSATSSGSNLGGGSAADSSSSSGNSSGHSSNSSSSNSSPNSSSSSLLCFSDQIKTKTSSSSSQLEASCSGVRSVSPPFANAVFSDATAIAAANSSPSSSSSSINSAKTADQTFGLLAGSKFGAYDPYRGFLGGFGTTGLPGSSAEVPATVASLAQLAHPHNHPLSFAAVANSMISSPVISSTSSTSKTAAMVDSPPITKEEKDLELKAKSHREAASRVSECQKTYEITRFENKPPLNAQYSTKVFIGGVPWDMTNDDMMEVFSAFGATGIQRPGKDVRLSRSSQGLDKAGYLYLIFDSEPYVHRLLKYCKLEMTEGGHRYFYMLYSKRSKKEKRVQVIPWNTSDSVCQVNRNAKEDQSRTVFLGALHGMMNSRAIAEALAQIFGPVEFVALDTDKYKYPMGSGRAMFTRNEDYLKAVGAGFVRVRSDRFEKTIQIDQFLDDKDCVHCGVAKAPVFCKPCQKYYCKVCWTGLHADEGAKNHPILMKSRFNSHNSKM